MDEKPLRGYADVGAVDDFDEGTAARVDADGVPLALFRSGGRFYALDDRCPHAGAPLSEASVDGGEIVCSWHAWRFELQTGRSTIVKGIAPVASHDVQVRDGRVLVRLAPRAPE